VTGPDEYSALADDNVYTNLMAQQNLQAAASAAARHPERALECGVDPAEVAAWQSAAVAMFVPYDAALGVHAQSQRFTEQEVWNFDATTPDQYPLLLHFPYFDLYRKQVVKQPDLVLAMHLRGDAFTDEEKARNFAYYERITVRDSSLSAGTEAVLAAELGHMDLAYDYLGEVALMDLNDLEHNTRDGIHMAAVAGAWIALVDGFGGMRTRADALSFAPRLPTGLNRLVFNLSYRDRWLRVTTTPATASYALLSGAPPRFSHYGRALTVTVDAPVRRKIPALPERPRPSQPPGREPSSRRRPSSDEPEPVAKPNGSPARKTREAAAQPRLTNLPSEGTPCAFSRKSR